MIVVEQLSSTCRGLREADQYADKALDQGHGSPFTKPTLPVFIKVRMAFTVAALELIVV